MHTLDETDIIRLFLDAMPAGRARANAFFDADAETLDYDGGKMLFTVDGFDDEDHFHTRDPAVLGHNLAAATVSDIFACGGSVRFYGHSATVSDRWDAAFIRALSRGIADVIRECGAEFAGGDLGRSSRWCYTGVAFGHADRAVTRRGAHPGDVLYITGPVGAGNLLAAAALLPLDMEALGMDKALEVRFPLRHREAGAVARHASACIDTSDGLIRSLAILSELNGTGYECADLPWHAPALALLDRLGLPPELLAAGECGEYELLCCIPPDREEAFLREAADRGCVLHRIGCITASGRRLRTAAGVLTLDSFDLTARRFPDHQAYLRELTAYFSSEHE